MIYADIMNSLPDWINLGLIGVTILIFVILILCFLRGMLRGWVKGTYHFVFMLILFIVAIATLDSVAGAFRTFNVSTMLPNPMRFTVNEVELEIVPTTAEGTIRDAIYAILHDAFKVDADPAVITNYATAVAISTIKFALVLAEGLIILIIGNLLALILWHLLFKHFLYRHKPKKQIRWLSGIQSLIVGIVTSALIIAPLSSMVNTVNNHVEIDQSATNNEYISLASKIADTYENSLFNRIFFSWAKPDGTNTIDVAFMNFLTESKSGDISVALLNEVGLMADAGSTAATLYFGNSFEDGIAWKSLLTSTEEVSLILDKVGKTQLFKCAIPYAIKLAVHFEKVVEFIGENAATDIGSMDVDPTKEIEIIKDIYQCSVDSGVFDIIEDGHSEAPVFDTSDLYNIIFNDTFHSKLEAITLDFDKMSVFNRAVAGLLYTQATTNPDWAKDDDPATLQLIDMLPLNDDGTVNEEKMVSYKWGEELITVIDPLYTIHTANPDGVHNLFDIIMEQVQPSSETSAAARKNAPGDESSTSESSGTDPHTERIVNAVLSLVCDSSDAVISAIVGSRQPDGTPIVNPDGKTTTEDACIMDSSLVVNACHVLPDFLAATMQGLKEGMDPIDVSASKAVLFADTSDAGIRTAFKKEFGAVLDVMGEVTKTPEGKALIKNYKDHPGVDIDPDSQFLGINENLARALQRGLRHIDQSLLLTDMVPPLAKAYLEGNEMLTSLGITELYYDDVGNELADLMDLFVYCPDMVAFAGTMKGNSSMDRIVAALGDPETADQLVHMLDIIGHCGIINPASAHNEPIYNIITSLTNSSVELDFEPADFDIPNLFSVYDEQGHRTSKGETYYLIDSLRVIVESGIMDTLKDIDSMPYADVIRQVAKVDLPALFDGIGSSSLFRKGITKVLDDSLIQKMLAPQDLDIEGISFANLNVGTEEEIRAAWHNEGVAFGQIVDLANTGIDLDNIDVFGADGQNVMNLLKKFASSGMFVRKYNNGSTEYLFPEYFYNKLIASLEPSSLKYFADEGQREIVGGLPNDAPLATKRGYTTLLHGNCTSLDTAEKWNGDGQQLDIFKELLRRVNEMGGLDAMNDLNPENAPQLRGALLVLANSEIVGNVVIANAVEDAIENIEATDFDFSNANTPYLWSLNGLADRDEARAKRIDEIDSICMVIEGLFDTHYGVYKDGQLDMSGMNVFTISTDYFIRPVLRGCLDSRVLRLPKDPAKLSVFELTMATFTKHSGIYGVIDSINVPISSYSSNKYCDYSIAQIIQNIDDATWVDEIDRLSAMIDCAKQTVFIDPVQHNIDFSVLSDPKAFFGSDVTGKNKQDLHNLVTLLNDSELFYRSLPFHLDGAFRDFDVMGGGTFMTDIGYADPYYSVTIRPGDIRDQDRYSQQDIDSLLGVLETFGVKASGINMTDITSIDADGVTTLLKELGLCAIFNEYNPLTSPTKDLDNYKQGLTSFQAIMSDFLCTDALKEYYYKATSPKDQHFSSEYNSLQTKAVYNVKTLFRTVSQGFGNEEIALLAGESGSLKSVLKALTSPTLAGIVSSTGFDVSSLNYETFMSLLVPLNDCKLTMDIVPNAISSMVLGTGAYATSIANVNFDRGNYYFSYYWYDTGTGFKKQAEPDFNQKFYLPELEQFASIVSFLSGNMDAINALSTFSISSIDPYLLRDLLCELNSSYVFHLSGPDTTTLASYAENANLKVEKIGGGFDELAPISVFEQLMLKIYLDSQLAAEAYDASFDLALYLKYGDNGAKAKVYQRIVDFGASHLGTSHDGDWFAEIEALTTDGRRHHGFELDDTEIGLIETVKSLNSILGGDNVNLSTEAFKKLSPAQIRWLLQGINRVDIICDALAYSTKSLVTFDTGGGDGLGLQRYTTDTYEADFSSGPQATYSVPEGVFKVGDQYTAVNSIKLAYTGSASEHFKVYVDISGVQTDVTSLTDAATVTASAGYVTISTNKLTLPFTVTCNDPGATFSGATLYYDTANFFQTQAHFAEKDIDALYYFLASVYRGKNSHPGEANELYFGFSDSDGITEFLDEGRTTSMDRTKFTHSTYGLMNFFLNSYIYGQKFNDAGLLTDGEASYLSGDFALYNLFQFDVEFNSIQATVQLADNFGSGDALSHLKYLYGKRTDYYTTPMTIEHTLLESAFLDNYIIPSGTYQAYIDASKIALANPIAPDSAFQVTNYAVGYNQYATVEPYLASAMSSEYHNTAYGHYDADLDDCPDAFKVSLDDPAVRQHITGNTDPITEPGYIGKSILAGQIRGTYDINYLSINLADASRTIASPTMAGTERSTLIGAKQAIDTYASNFAGLKDNFEMLHEQMQVLNASFAGVTNILSLNPMTGPQKEALANAIETYLKMDTGDHKAMDDAFYLGSLYNVLVYRAVFYNLNAMAQNDFPDLLHATNTLQLVAGYPPVQTNVAWSYDNVATAIRQSLGV